MNKKIIVGIVIALIIVAVAAVFVISSNNGNGNNILNNITNGKATLWTISINGKNITLPCKLSELTETGLKIDEYDYEKIINSSNQTFSMIYASSEGWQEGVYLKIVTGNDSTKKEENATVTVITNMITTDLYGRYDVSDSTTKEQFHLRDNISMGSSKEEVINAFGDNYLEPNGSEFEGLYDVLTWDIAYVEDSNRVMFHFKNGVLTIITIQNESF